ncbi:hypothetical protein GLOTRDRAFT_140147 [Gloeophyllum trabeum ATCC 11539]|uniref:Actin-like ATPase domain-containing protein n=1 Tax=Gloeophyllum trabeum (strain ATCC 11539 / FP-39264 / Madison 617) TaxID=670483 RepID=S7RGF6_GLOTA|nr:uncharacterized protein GLOTRDRAFT_140147 [Gloeophyllum trabeum ATCC 11539]EPQ53305.1 hypothetical protein GLOTRDRAFT_140147 [Gloeophyllum trabeum ATCC 11539]
MSDSNNQRKPYAGKGRRLVVAIDVGTTFTAASFCILQEGRIPKFEEVLRWPKQVTADAKVPSVLYYDKRGNPCAFAAETDDEDVIMAAEANEWYKAEWWKLHLRPGHLPIIRDLKLPALPLHRTAEDVFADYLEYVKTQVKEYITTTYGEGANMWTTLSATMYVILTTPNGWEGAQQNKMRAAAIKAGLVGADGARRIRFVTEAEAAVLYAVDSGCVSDWLVKDGHLILCDCGGGTVDITGYRIKELSPLRLEESSASRCYLAGAVFITQAAKEYLKVRLAGTEWDNEEAIQRATDDFDKNAKRKFDNPEATYWINLNGFKSVADLGIVRGRLKISGQDMAAFFEPSLKSIKEGLEIAFENGDRLADKIILVGGLASSPYVYSQLVKWGEENGIPVSRPDGPTTKAVANGALAWHIDDSVSARVSKCHYGIQIRISYDPSCEESRQRPREIGLDGRERVLGAWSCILPKNTSVDSTKQFTKPFYVEWNEGPSDNFLKEVDIYIYRRAKPPKFLRFLGKDMLQPGFEVLCTIKGDLRRCFESSLSHLSPTTGQRYRKVEFEVCLQLGETELTAQMRWKENGEWVYGDATVAYE